MKSVCLLLSLPFVAPAQTVDAITDPVEYVNPLMGTASSLELSNGNTYPAIALPFGMNCYSPQTSKTAEDKMANFIYTYQSNYTYGFKQTHQPSIWIKDYGQFMVMPVTRRNGFSEEDRKSWYSHKAETAKPYYYSSYLADHHVRAEITPTERAASFRFSFHKTDSSYLVVDALDRGSYVKIIPAEKKIIGYSTKNSGGVPKNFKNYFVLVFNKPFLNTAVWQDTLLVPGLLELTANRAGAVVGFAPGSAEPLTVKVASSFISFEQAERNLNEIGNADFETVKRQAKAAWNKELSKITVTGGTVDQTRTFYSCLYRMLLFPRKFYEIDADGKAVHYSVYNGNVLPGYLFADTGFWDTFRAQFPFFNLLYPSLNSKILQGVENTYKESGWLPEWTSPGHRGSMIGSHSASVIADAYLKGIRGYDIQLLYEGILKNTLSRGLEGTATGRAGAKEYNQYNYLPYNLVPQSVSRTLEYAYDDFAIYQLAKALNRTEEEINRFAKRCQNYRNLFDTQTKLMRPKDKAGDFLVPFDPFKWGDAFTESNSWQYTWSVFHDPQGLSDLMGGTDSFVAKLDSVFSLPPVFDVSYYKRGVIHLIREMQAVDMGQYAHGNQPVHHMIYLYNYGAPWKAQYWLREAMNRLYSPAPDGYCGDEDNGETSAWYVFSAMGFYPVCPATDQYVLGAPLFKKITLQLENGKQIIINAPANSHGNRYVKRLSVNGKPYSKNWLSHASLLQGGVLNFDMTDKPNKIRGITPADFPFSFSRSGISK